MGVYGTCKGQGHRDWSELRILSNLIILILTGSSNEKLARQILLERYSSYFIFPFLDWSDTVCLVLLSECSDGSQICFLCQALTVCHLPFKIPWKHIHVQHGEDRQWSNWIHLSFWMNNKQSCLLHIWSVVLVIDDLCVIKLDSLG